MTEPKNEMRAQAAAQRTGARLAWLANRIQFGCFVMAPMVTGPGAAARKARPTAEPRPDRRPLAPREPQRRQKFPRSPSPQRKCPAFTRPLRTWRLTHAFIGR